MVCLSAFPCTMSGTAPVRLVPDWARVTSCDETRLSALPCTIGDAAPVTLMPDRMRVISCDKAMVDVPRRGDWMIAHTEALLWKSMSSYHTVGVLPTGEPVLVAGEPRVVDGHTMIPTTDGAVELSFLRPAVAVDFAVRPDIPIIYVELQKKGRLGRRHMRQRKEADGGQPRSAKPLHTCLVDAFRRLGIKVPYCGDGPFWALEDGRSMLEPFGKTIEAVGCNYLLRGGRYVIYKDYHFRALLTTCEGVMIASGDNTWDKACLEDEVPLDSLLYKTYEVVDDSYMIFRVLDMHDRHDPPVQSSRDRFGGADYNERVLARWEAPQFERLVRRRIDLAMHVDRVAEEESLRASVERTQRRVAAELEQWDLEPDAEITAALEIICYLITDQPTIERGNDLLACRIVAFIVDKSTRAHTCGCYSYKNGAFRRVEELDEPVLKRVERVCKTAQKVLRHVARQNIGRNIKAVVAAVEDVAFDLSGQAPVLAGDLARRGGNGAPPVAEWAIDLCQGMRSYTGRFTGKGAAKELLDLLGTWMQTPRTDPATPCVTCEDMSFLFKPSPGGHQLERIRKSPVHNCYFGLPIELAVEPPDWVLDKLRVILATSYAGQDAGRTIEMSAEALAFMSQTMPPVLIWLSGNGGNAKSARGILRANVFGDHHAVLSSEALQKPDEFRKQGGQFAYCRAITVPEVEPGIPLEEANTKRWISGDRIACRPLFGKTTTYYSWSKSMKVVESNVKLPSIRGDPRDLHSLRSMLRRFIHVELGGMFTSDPEKVSIDGKSFVEDATLAEFLSSDWIRLAYIKRILLPFIEITTLEQCRGNLLNPPAVIVEATRRLVAQMANGGLDMPGNMKSKTEDDEVAKRAELLIKEAHFEAAGSDNVYT